MSDFLTSLAAREAGQVRAVLPRLPSRFEPAERKAPGAITDLEPEPGSEPPATPATPPVRARRISTPAAAMPPQTADDEPSVRPQAPAKTRRAPVPAAQESPLPSPRSEAAPVRATAVRAPVAMESMAPAPARPVPRRDPPRAAVVPPAPAPAAPALAAAPVPAAPPRPSPRVADRVVQAAPQQSVSRRASRAESAVQPAARPAAGIAQPPASPAARPAPVLEAPAPALLPARRINVLMPAPHPVAAQIHTPAVREVQASAPAPTIHVSIGRVEIRAVSAPPPAAPKAPAATPALSLEQFLAQQKERASR